MIEILLGVLLGVFIYYKLIKPARYWEDKDVVHEPSWPIVGTMGQAVLRKKQSMYLLIDQYKKHPDSRYVGIMQFSRPMLMIRDVDLIKQLAVKDFEHFHDHFSFAKNEDDPVLAKGLMSLQGQEWRQMRATLSPVFTSSKMRSMYQLMADCAENFVGHFKGKEQVAIEMKEVFSRFTTDVIASAAFGIQVDSFKEPNNTFFVMGGKLNRGIFQFMKIIMLAKFPFLAKILGANVFPVEAIDFFRSTINDNITKREKEGIVRPDLIHLLMEARKGRLKAETDGSRSEGFAAVEESNIGRNTKQLKLTDSDILSQAMLFFFAGFDTASITSCFIAYELAVHPEIQEKLQNEIDAVNQEHKGKIPYNVLQSMKYLDQVVCETLRLWTPGFQTERICTKDYEIQPKLSNERKIFLGDGDSILIPIAAIHRDSKYYPEPEKFNPERFSDENKPKIVPGTYMPFGLGPRNCIGSRFALLEIKTLFFHLLSKFDIVVTDSTQIPLKLSKKSVNLAAENGFWLGFRPRKVTFY